MEKSKNTVNKIKNLGIYAPWVIFYRQIEALFAKDSEIRVEYNDDKKIIKLFVDNPEKANALSKLLPAQRVYGNIAVTVEVVPANLKKSPANDFQVAFEGNEAFSHITTIESIPDMYISNPISYCSFKKEVVQYPADDLGSETGLKSTLYEDIAREIFGEIGGLYFCTDRE